MPCRTECSARLTLEAAKSIVQGWLEVASLVGNIESLRILNEIPASPCIQLGSILCVACGSDPHSNAHSGYVRIHTIYTQMSVHNMHLQIHIPLHADLPVYVDVHAHVHIGRHDMYIYICMCIYIYTCKVMYNVHIDIDIDLDIDMGMGIGIYMYTYKSTYIYTDSHRYMRQHIQMVGARISPPHGCVTFLQFLG